MCKIHLRYFSYWEPNNPASLEVFHPILTTRATTTLRSSQGYNNHFVSTFRLALVPCHCLKSQSTQSTDSQGPQGRHAPQGAGPSLRFVPFLSLPAVGPLWLGAIPLSLCATAMHSMWYSSFTQTTPAVNTLESRSIFSENDLCRRSKPLF